MISTHILHEADAVADRVLLVNSGRLVFDGPVDELKEDGSLEQPFYRLTGGAAPAGAAGNAAAGDGGAADGGEAAGDGAGPGGGADTAAAGDAESREESAPEARG